MFAIIAALLFAIAAMLAFGTISGISVIGLMAIGLACVSLHLAGVGAGFAPWRRVP